MIKYPKVLYRNDDGQEFRLINEKGFYSIYNDGLGFGIHKHYYHALMRVGFKHQLKDCKIRPGKRISDGSSSEY